MPKPKAKPKSKTTLKPKPKAQPKPDQGRVIALSNRAAAVPPVTATVLQSVDGTWAVDVAISHGDLTVVRINGRAVWLGTP